MCTRIRLFCLLTILIVVWLAYEAGDAPATARTLVPTPLVFASGSSTSAALTLGGSSEECMTIASSNIAAMQAACVEVTVLAGDSRCSLGGIGCQTEGAHCTTKGGHTGTCKTHVIKRGGGDTECRRCDCKKS